MRPGNKIFIPLFVVAVALFATWDSQRDRGSAPAAAEEPSARSPGPAHGDDKTRSGPPSRPSAGQKLPFDFYLLALTSHPAFCTDRAREPECRAGSPPPISIHGLWPENLDPGRYPRDCPGPRLDLEDELERRLATLMPGMADGLHEHEWRKHGTCTGLDDDRYFHAAYSLARRVDAALGSRLTSLAGGRSSAAELREHADQAEPGLGATLTFHCRTLRQAPSEHRREPYLVEIRQCLEADGAGGLPGEPANCARFNRRDQGCGAGFRIAGR